MDVKKFRAHLNATDLAFAVIKLLVLGACAVWIYFHPLPSRYRADLLFLAVAFLIYTFILYGYVFKYPERTRRLYFLEFILDLLFLSLILPITGGLNSAFAFAFYLLAAVHSFYYGFFASIGVAALSSSAYLLSCPGEWRALHWTDSMLRVVIMFLIALTLGYLSGRERRMHRKLIRAEQFAAMGMMSSRIAHEVKNPLSSIVLNAELLADELKKYSGVDTSEARGILNSIMNEVERLDHVTEDYLRYVRKPKFKYEACDINALVDSLMGLFEKEAVLRKVSFNRNLKEGLPTLSIDERQLRQALMNILRNSFEAMPQGGEIFVATKRVKDDIEITIKDTGVGIARGYREKIFEPFFSTKDTGTGLGLYIARDIVGEHGGDIICESQKGKGAAFIIRLPIKGLS